MIMKLRCKINFLPLGESGKGKGGSSEIMENFNVL